MTPSPLSLALLCSSFLSCANSASSATMKDVPQKLEVGTVTHAGDACPVSGKKLEASLDASRTRIFMATPRMSAQFEKAPKSFLRTRCEVTVTLSHEAGWQVRPLSFELVAHATSLNEGAQAEALHSFHFQGSQDTRTASIPLAASVQAANTSQVEIPETWSPCGTHAVLVQNVALLLKGAQATDAKLTAEAGWNLVLQWRRCHS